MTEDNKTSGIIRSGWWLVATSAAFIIIILILFLAKTDASNKLPIDPAIFGQYGDIIGGVAGTFVALVGVLFLYETLTLQRLQLNEPQKQEAIRLKEVEEYFIVALENIQNAIPNPINDLKSVIKELSKPIGGNIPLPKPELSFKALNWISQNDLFKIIYKNKNIKINNGDFYWKTNQFLEFINKFEGYYKEIMNDFRGDLKKYEKNWQEGMTIIRKTKVQMQVDSLNNRKKKSVNSQFLIEILKIESHWIKLENHKTFDIATKDFLHPIIELCNDPKTKVNNDIITINDGALSALLAYTNLMNATQSTKDRINELLQNLETIKDSLPTFFKVLKREVNA